MTITLKDIRGSNPSYRILSSISNRRFQGKPAHVENAINVRRQITSAFGLKIVREYR